MERQQWQVLLKLGNDCFHDKAWNEAEFFYSEAYDLLAFSYRNNPMCANSKIDDEDVKLIAFKGLSFTLKPILAFNKKHPICDDCIERFTSLKLLLEQQKNVIH